MICQICQLECKSGQALSKHISCKHKISAKDYYDKYIKQISEGICPICNNTTPFLGFKKGYQTYCSAKCAQNGDNNVFKTNNPRKIKNKITSYNCKTINFTCDICNKSYTNKISVNNHIIKGHKMSLYDYWSQYQSDKCCICGNQLNVTSLGFNKYCSSKCRNIYLYGTLSNIQKTKDKQNKVNQIRIDFESNNDVISYIDAIDKYGQGWLTIKDSVPMITIAGKKYITDTTNIENYCKINHYRNNNVEQQIINFIKSIYDKNIICHSRKIISPLELDIYLPDLKLTIEYNGTFWHSIEQGLDKDYHLNKSIMCRNNNIRLIHIYGFENLNKQLELLKSFILGQDNYPKNDFNKNNLINNIPSKSVIIYKDNH